MKESRELGDVDLDQELRSSSAPRSGSEKDEGEISTELDGINKDKPVLSPTSPGRKKKKKRKRGKRKGGQVAQEMIYDELIESSKQLFFDSDSDLILETRFRQDF